MKPHQDRQISLDGAREACRFTVPPFVCFWTIFRTRRTILKEAEQHVGSKYVDRVLDSFYVIETAMRHFFIRAEMGKNAAAKRKKLTRITSKLRLLQRWWHRIGVRD